jgi:hypothetical protein
MPVIYEKYKEIIGRLLLGGSVGAIVAPVVGFLMIFSGIPVFTSKALQLHSFGNLGVYYTYFWFLLAGLIIGFVTGSIGGLVGGFFAADKGAIVGGIFLGVLGIICLYLV